jgi:hypothetical protein
MQRGEVAMKTGSWILASCLVCLTVTAAAAQSTATQTIPRQIGNRANGFSYQPTPEQVVPSEKAAGILPSDARQRSTDTTLSQLDHRLLAQEHLNPDQAPDFTAH